MKIARFTVFGRHNGDAVVQRTFIDLQIVSFTEDIVDSMEILGTGVVADVDIRTTVELPM